LLIVGLLYASKFLRSMYIIVWIIYSPSPGCPVRKHGEDTRRKRLRCAMATGDRAVAIRAKAGWASVEIKSSCFGAVSLGFATDAPRGSAGSFT
jgi:hypothetical protein